MALHSPYLVGPEPQTPTTHSSVIVMTFTTSRCHLHFYLITTGISQDGLGYAVLTNKIPKSQRLRKGVPFFPVLRGHHGLAVPPLHVICPPGPRLKGRENTTWRTMCLLLTLLLPLHGPHWPVQILEPGLTSTGRNYAPAPAQIANHDHVHHTTWYQHGLKFFLKQM